MKIFIILFLIALFAGYVMTKIISAVKFRKPIGTLRLDRSDETPYLFLEIEDSGMEQILKKKYVVLKVSLENYISRE